MPTTRIEPKHGYANINGLKLHYVDWGIEGNPPFVLLHGFSAMARYWDGFAVNMRDQFHVYALDQRGHGDSEWAEDYGPETMPADLEQFVDGLGLQTFSLMGHSMGGGVAYRYTAEHPERVTRLIIVDAGLPNPDRIAPPNPDNSVARSIARSMFENEDELFQHLMRQSPGANPERVREVMPFWFKRLDDGRYTFKWDPKLRGRIGSADPEALARQRESAANLRQAVKRITCPVLLLRGTNSDLLSEEAAEDSVAALPNATLMTIPNAGHNIPSDNPRAFREAVKDWIVRTS